MHLRDILILQVHLLIGSDAKPEATMMAKAKITHYKHVTNEQFSFSRVAMPQGVYLVQNFTRKVFGGAHFCLA